MGAGARYSALLHAQIYHACLTNFGWLYLAEWKLAIAGLVIVFIPLIV